MVAVTSGASDFELMSNHASVMARYSGFIMQYRRSYFASMLMFDAFTPLAGWQTSLCEKLNRPPCGRGLSWVYSNHGNVGKSYMATHFNPAKTLVISSGQHADIYYVLSLHMHSIDCVWFDYPRDKEMMFPYAVIEQLKNCHFVSTKYMSCIVRHKPVHVVVTCNFAPDWTKLSADRWLGNVWFVRADGTVNFEENGALNILF